DSRDGGPAMTSPLTTPLSDDPTVVQRILDHIDHQTTDMSEASWREPLAHYRSEERYAAELALVLRRYPTPFCPSAALPESGSYATPQGRRSSRCAGAMVG